MEKTKEKNSEKNRSKTEAKFAIGIDPGFDGAFVLTNLSDAIFIWPMPVTKEAKTKRINLVEVRKILINANLYCRIDGVFLEKPVSFGMSPRGAFNYGRGYESLLIAIEQEFPNLLKLVEPSRWTKVMHEGIRKDLQPKAKSLKAVKKRFPHLVRELPTNRNKRVLDGPVDALLIAAYGLSNVVEDFY